MAAYFNEIDPYAADWLRNLIAAGHIAPGDVDERSIEDVHPDDLRSYTQCHFFAGIGVWSYALRRAGWPDDRPVWTGSCPCQPFSSAGKGTAFDDERHLWPAWHWLIQECRPPVVFGEQVASKDAEPWLDLVSTDLEALGFATAAFAFPSASVGAPHKRDRTYFVAHAKQHDCGRQASTADHNRPQARGSSNRACRCGSTPCRLGHSYGERAGRDGRSVRGQVDRQDRQFGADDAGAPGGPGGLADADGRHTGTERQQRGGEQRQQPSDGRTGDVADTASGGRREERADAGRRHVRDLTQGLAAGPGHGGGDLRPGPVNGFWRAADWLLCRDGKWRPVSPKPQPLVDGSAESLGRVRPGIVKEVEEEINAWTVESQIDGSQALRDLLIHLGTQAQRCWEAGRIPGLHEAPFLLAFLRQLTEQGWRISERLPVSCEEVAEASMRSVRRDGEQTGSSHQYGLEGQQTGERADPVPVLSSLLARHARAAWDNAHAAYAETAFPLAHGARSRVGRLRAYGNAINAQQAQIFIEECMRCI